MPDHIKVRERVCHYMNCKSVFPLVGVSVLLPLFAAVDAAAQFVAFNDHAPGAGTAPNTTTWNALGEAASSGPLKNITTGATLPVTLTITRSATGVTGAATQGDPAPGTPLYTTFNGFVDFQGTPNPSVQVESGGVLTYTFTGLNPSKRYSFKGSAVRGNVAYTDRWTLCEIVGADSFTSAHTANALTTAKVPSLTASQVAINTGVNSTAATGDMAVWESINPGADGSFAVTCRQYTGTVPGGSSAGMRAYGITSLRLEEFNVTPASVTITNQPQDQVVDELQGAAFSVGATGNPAPTYQWYKNDVLIGGATNSSYTIAAAPLSDNNARFKLIAANTVNSVNYSQTSGVAVLRVRADTTPPRLIEAQPLGLTQVKVAFSELVSVATATSIANYTFTSGNGSLTLSAATLDASQTNVLLDISPLTEGVLYTLTVNGVRDQSLAANQIAANSQTTFIAVSYTPQDIGSPPLAGSAVAAPGGYDVTGSGADIGGTADQFHLSYQQLTSDFDLKVRVAGLDVSDVWAKAGLMARETLDADSRFAAVLATPTLSGCFFQSRTTVAAPASSAGSFPINYPSTWLRLRR